MTFFSKTPIFSWLFRTVFIFLFFLTFLTLWQPCLLLPLYEILCQWWREEEVSQEVRFTIIITLHKNKGERTDCKSYRGIFLLSIVDNTFVFCYTRSNTTPCRTFISRITVWISFRSINNWYDFFNLSAPVKI